MSENPRRLFCLKVWGDFACFTRPEMKVERVSYDVITPSAARAVFSAILWKPAIRWHIKRIEVLNPIAFTSVRRNEVGALASPRGKVFIEEARQQKAGLLLRDVAYRLYAELEFIPPTQREDDLFPKSDESPQKYFEMFERRAKKGQTFHMPYLGCREFAASFDFVPASEAERVRQQEPALDASHDRDFGFMLYDMNYTLPEAPEPMFYRPVMRSGVIEVPDVTESEVYR